MGCICSQSAIASIAAINQFIQTKQTTLSPPTSQHNSLFQRTAVRRTQPRAGRSLGLLAAASGNHDQTQRCSKIKQPM
jgi:hypothetical protein